MEKIPVYSPGQVGAASFVGGPLAAVYVLWKNFTTLGNASAASQTLIWGTLFNLLVLVMVPILPEKFPNYVIPLAYALAARYAAEKYQLTKPAILASEQFTFQSNWTVVGVAVACLVIFVAILFAWIFALDTFGIIKL